MSEYNITLFEACELLNRSKKSISRYIRRGLLHPEKVKSQQGTLEYRFSKADIEAFKAQEAQRADETGQDGTQETGHIKATFIANKEVLEETRQDTPEQTRPDRTRETGQDNEVLTLLKETTGFLKEQLVKKDEQIKDLGGKIDQLIERDRETNIILKGLQDKVFMIEGGKNEPINSETDEPADTFVQDLANKPDPDLQDLAKPEQTGQEPDQTGQDKAGETGQDKPAKKSFFEKVKDFFKAEPK